MPPKPAPKPEQPQDPQPPTATPRPPAPALLDQFLGEHKMVLIKTTFLSQALISAAYADEAPAK